MYKIIGGDGQTYGPVTEEQLRQWVADGRANRQTMAQAEGATDWKPLGEFPAFAGVTAPPSATPPPLPAAAPRPASPAPTSGMAITSLVLGILGLITCGITAIPGLILGLVSLAKINRSGGRLGGNGLAIGGICVSGAMLLIVPLFAAMLLPALNSARGAARAASCSSNLRQLGLAMALYADTNHDRMPDASNWCDALKTFAGNDQTFRCPAAGLQRCSYGFNQALSGREWGKDPLVVVLFEIDGGWNVAGDRSRLLLTSRHPRGYCFLFGDGHVEVVPAARVAGLQWNPQPDSR